MNHPLFSWYTSLGRKKQMATTTTMSNTSGRRPMKNNHHHEQSGASSLDRRAMSAGSSSFSDINLLSPVLQQQQHQQHYHSQPSRLAFPTSTSHASQSLHSQQQQQQRCYHSSSSRRSTTKSASQQQQRVTSTSFHKRSQPRKSVVAAARTFSSRRRRSSIGSGVAAMASSSSGSTAGPSIPAIGFGALLLIQAAVIVNEHYEQQQQRYLTQQLDLSEEDDCETAPNPQLELVPSPRTRIPVLQQVPLPQFSAACSSSWSLISGRLTTHPSQPYSYPNYALYYGWITPNHSRAALHHNNKQQQGLLVDPSTLTALCSSVFYHPRKVLTTSMEAAEAGATSNMFGAASSEAGVSSSSSVSPSPTPSSPPPGQPRNRSLARRRGATVAGQLAEASEKGVTLESKFKVNWRRPLGEGTFGAVYSGTNRATGEAVAIKKITKSCTDQVVFQNEMQVLLELRDHGGHPNICGLQAAFDSDDGHYYLVLDLIAGGELFHHLCEQGPYSEADAARLVREVASALNFMHGLGVVHGDLKPENLMLSTREKAAAVVKVVDFGCAQIRPVADPAEPQTTGHLSSLVSLAWGRSKPKQSASNGSASASASSSVSYQDEASNGSTRGTALTPAYSSPEVLKRKQLVDKLKKERKAQQQRQPSPANAVSPPGPASVLDPSFDMWALGVILYILLTAVHPFDLSGTSTDEEIEQAIVSGHNPPLGNSPLTAHLSADAVKVIELLLQWDPMNRVTAQELLENPWVRGETARTQKMQDSDKRLSAYRAFQTSLQAKAFAGMVAVSMGAHNINDGGDDTTAARTPKKKAAAASVSSTASSTQLFSADEPVVPDSVNGDAAGGTGKGGPGTAAIVDNSVAKRTSLIERSFQMFDPDHRGYIPAKELRKLVGDQGQQDESALGGVGDLSLSGFSDILSEHMHNKYFPKGHMIYREGEAGHSMFFLNSGTIEIFTKDGYRAQRQSGEFFGEGALLNPNQIRSASIKCVTPIHAIEISREYFEKYIATDHGVKLNLREKDKARKRQRAKMLLQLQKNMEERLYKKGDYLFRKGEEGNTLFLVDEGQVVLTTGDQDIIYVGKGEMTGEHSFVFGRKRNVDAKCVADECKVFVMKARDFYKLLDSHPSFKESIREICLRREFQKAFCAKSGQSFPKTEAALRDAFDFVGTGKTGKIELNEISSLLKDFDPTYTEQDIKDILDALDLDDTGTVDWEEFKRIFGMGDKQKKTGNGERNSKTRKRRKWKR